MSRLSARGVVIAGLMVAGAPAASAQSMPDLAPLPGAVANPTTTDPGRPRGDERTGLSARGGPNPTGSDRTYSATIGSQIYSPFVTTIGSPY